MHTLRYLLLTLSLFLPACVPPQDAPRPHTGRLLVFVQANCPPCEISRRELTPDRLPIPIDWVDIGADPVQASKWSIPGTPVYVLVDAEGHEIARKVGHHSPIQLQRWLDRFR